MNVIHSYINASILHLYGYSKGYKTVLFFLFFIIPFYPSLSVFVYENNQYEFARDDIDESSILGSYYVDTQDSSSGEDTSELPILESSDYFLSVNTILDDERDLTGTNEIVDYEVKAGDSISVIAYNFKVSNNSIYWANDFSRNHVIRPGDIIKIPPVSGLIHQVKKGDTIETIAKKYNVGMNKILSQNLLSLDDILQIGEVIVVPGAIKIIKRPVYKAPPKQYAKKSPTSGYTFTKGARSNYVNGGGTYQLEWRKPKANFYWGNCTWYVAQYKNVNWQGNANQWLTNAKRKGHKTGSKPTLGSIVVFDGRGYNPRYGHVGIVTDIKGTDIIVTDMNYRKLNEVTYRRVPINNRSIKGYIYVD